MEKTKLDLVPPTKKHKTQVESFKQKLTATTGEGFDGCGDLENLDFNEWLTQCNDWRAGANLPNGYVPSSQFLAIRANDSKLVGMIQIRHNLDSENLKNFYGHIGYTITPEERRKGYATQMLKLALPECKKLGVTKVLITCATTNTASARTIEKNGGILESTVTHNNETLNRYWINL